MSKDFNDQEFCPNCKKRKNCPSLGGCYNVETNKFDKFIPEYKSNKSIFSILKSKFTEICKKIV